ncbi:MAG: deoxyhypusine synthase family protein [Candidatus Aenigmarchaeota archaeon]|nr:deoxyhypusine synthase family protein [Candidatus Aenigmarchaeota archaeon]
MYSKLAIGRGQNVNELVRQMKDTAFNARKLGHAADILENMIKDPECKTFLTLAGAMIPAGMKGIVHDMLGRKWIDALITTGANLTHDLVESLEYHHFQLDENSYSTSQNSHGINSLTVSSYDKYDDKELAQESIYRIYDCFMPGEVYTKLEKFIQSAIDKMPMKEMSIQEFLHEFGKHCPENSILNICSRNNISVFCPAFADSGIGIQIWFYIQDKQLKVNALNDLKNIFDITWTAKKLGVFIIGGGVPKNYAMQAFQFSNSAKYFVQITTDREDYGGLSGATPQEAISWGKISADANFADIRCDATICLPILYSCLIDRL